MNHAVAVEAKKIAVLYARTGSAQQGPGVYPDCDAQIQELEIVARRQGWNEFKIIKDEGYSANALDRPGLTELRELLASDDIGAVFCTCYDRLSRSRHFYTLDKEFQEHGVRLITLQIANDMTTTSGRFMETMIHGAKTYEREQDEHDSATPGERFIETVLSAARNYELEMTARETAVVTGARHRIEGNLL